MRQTQRGPHILATARKTDALSIRIDPRMKYGLELLARHQRRAVTGVVEWTLSEAFKSETIAAPQGVTINFDQIVRLTWSENEIERVLALYFNFPTLLSYEESRVVNTLLRTYDLWRDLDSSKLSNFKAHEVLPHWEKLRPVVEKAAARTPQTGLTEEDFKAGGIAKLWDPLPF
jgi:hypothetical protein